MQQTKEERRAYKAQRRAEKLNNSESIVDNSNRNIVLCVRFGQRYGREYVEKLRNMVSRNLTIPYEFVCLTDDSIPIEGVRSIIQPNAKYAKGWWHKVHMFDHALPLTGRILFFDLDVVIHHNIDKLFTISETDFYGIHDFNRKFYSGWVNLNSSVMAWTHGTQNHIWDKFKVNPQDAMRLQGDQDWIWRTSRDRIKFWPQEWIQSYKWEIRTRQDISIKNGRRMFREAKDDIVLPEGCCVTVFHGEPKPQDVQDKLIVDNWR